MKVKHDAPCSELACLAAQLYDLQNQAVRACEPIVERMIHSTSRDMPPFVGLLTDSPRIMRG